MALASIPSTSPTVTVCEVSRLTVMRAVLLVCSAPIGCEEPVPVRVTARLTEFTRSPPMACDTTEGRPPV